MTGETKVCTKCGMEKPLDEFYKTKTSKDGYRGTCISCFSENSKTNFEKIRKIPIEERDIPEFKICKKCGIIKPINEFRKDKLKKDGHQSHCKICEFKIQKKYREENKDKPRKKIIKIEYKVCKKCGIEKPVNDFYGASNTNDGYRTRCKECIGEYEKLIFKNKPKKPKVDRSDEIREKRAKIIIEKCEKLNYEFIGWVDNGYKCSDRIILRCKKHDYIWKPVCSEFYRNRASGCPKCSLELNVCENFLFIALNKKYDDLFVYQYRNKEVLDRLSFDFYFPKYKIAIEYQGGHHFKPIVYGKNVDRSIYDYNNTIERDKRKNKICKDNNIKLLYFLYTGRGKVPENYIDKIYTKETELFDIIDKIIEEYNLKILI